MSEASLPHLVVVGGGFAGLWATRALASAPLRITLVDRGNHHLFQPLLYQVATAGLSAPDIAAPLRHILRRQRNATVLMEDVAAIEPASSRLRLDDGRTLERREDATADVQRVVQRLQSRRVRGPVVVAEVGVGRAAGEQQEIVIERAPVAEPQSR